MFPDTFIIRICLIENTQDGPQFIQNHFHINSICIQLLDLSKEHLALPESAVDLVPLLACEVVHGISEVFRVGHLFLVQSNQFVLGEHLNRVPNKGRYVPAAYRLAKFPCVLDTVWNENLIDE